MLRDLDASRAHKASEGMLGSRYPYGRAKDMVHLALGASMGQLTGRLLGLRYLGPVQGSELGHNAVT